MSEKEKVVDDEGTPPPEADVGRQQTVFVRHQADCGAMSWGDRVKRRWRAALKEPSPEDHAGVNVTPDGQPQVQYRLESTEKQQSGGFFHRLTHCFSRPSGSGMVGINPNQKLAMYLHWMFRVNFIFLFAVMCVMFFALVIFFAALITAVGNIDRECVRIGSEEFDAADTAFADAFALSWTTFSTVGYGSTYPALGHQNTNPTNCFFINFVCSLESLVGVLYSGFCGAILFGKVLRIQSHAQVIFSDPLVIRYGSGLTQGAHDDEKDKEDDDEEADPKIPCPVLEFRIVNRLYNEVGGEIMDATLNCVANVDSNDLDPNRDHLSDSGHGPSANSTRSDSGSEAGSSMMGSDRTGANSLHRFLAFSGFSLHRNQQTVDEDPTSRLVTKHIFSKLHIEASDHPFFKRVWLARHTLDEDSPIVKPRIRRQIKRNGGFWPNKYNNYAAIRDSLQFNQILVSLNGVSNVSASDVYAQKIYDFVDVNIGYQFVNLLYREGDGKLGVDTDLVNDVREQNGGGGEPLAVE
uniref:Inward rectifier potassium channel C-terminal domain-containing protein n=1 Tax=Entomoneis paludosa TaxID=265537 RepID=A0A7S3DV82_9STRA|mmetsp:Transcript_39044/g.81057  ORF Transcript_39044/g.81057 Transcript_39044/m.81057 type:complete len:522 (+) Transcript_39044:172-1737(+)|eukprot:CAMPEP_0172457940 /NCGR_PEP_ID=MMETSP1065-20121228/25170_1 /TAXON_ID=265537 /ORGANISM="Amphiprora paludosa, Strain CCMP125" /LENGTH=521 /DNA_ID=CAMNT_0013211953 /DNA_START=151 /DNA_END=1716 /DNA_ORIENTATION=+